MSKEPMSIIDAEDLELYIDNEYDLYNDLWTPITTKLTKMKDAGKYKKAKTPAFMSLVQAGARRYQKEFPNSLITPAVKRETAASLLNRFEIEYELGNYEYLVE